jgi:hypothetical protein
MEKSRLAPLLVGRFDLVQVDGWLDDLYLDDLVGEDAWIEIAADGSGEFKIGDVEGALFADVLAEDSIRWRWSATWCGDGLVGTGWVGLPQEEGSLFGVFRCQGEDQPWGFTAERSGARESRLARRTAPAASSQP